MESSVAALQVNTGSTAVGDPEKSDCENLNDTNKCGRDSISDRTKNKTMVGTDGCQNGTTVSSCKITPKQSGGMVTVASGHSRAWAHEHLPDQFVKGGDEATRTGQKSVLCGQNQVAHAPPYKQKSGHAEARILDELIGARKDPCKLTFNINWKNKEGKPSKMPCEDCHKLICEALACGHEIELCDKKGKSQPVNQENCPANKKSYEKLQKKMGESF
jgi:hypothetical protein